MRIEYFPTYLMEKFEKFFEIPIFKEIYNEQISR